MTRLLTAAEVSLILFGPALLLLAVLSIGEAIGEALDRKRRWRR